MQDILTLSLSNFILRTDSYKLTHWMIYPKGTKKVYSYLESRGGKFEKTVFFELQYYVMEYLEKTTVTKEDVLEAKLFSYAHFGTDKYFNYDGWMYIVNELNGKIPVEIKAVKEGTLVPTSNVLMTIVNTDDRCPWITNVIETLLMKLWYPITVATNSFYRKLDIAERIYISNDGDLSSLPFKLHDFGYRGVSSEESAGIGGAAHLTSFMGTDTIRGIVFAHNYYKSGVCGYSVLATEHSVATSYTRYNEEGYFLSVLDNTPEDKIGSIVCDTYNSYKFVRTMSEKYKERILARSSSGSIVYRPDSGDPVDVNAGKGVMEDGNHYEYIPSGSMFNKKVPITRDEYLGLMGILWEVFGDRGTIVNGYKLLPPQVRLLQGDGINDETIREILDALIADGYSADNMVFGSVGALIQKFDRDTCKFAIKASFAIITVDGVDEYRDLVKDPYTGSGKKSKPGVLKLVKDGESFKTLSSVNVSKEEFDAAEDCLETVYLNGKLTRHQNFDNVREITETYFKQEFDKRIKSLDGIQE